MLNCFTFSIKHFILSVILFFQIIHICRHLFNILQTCVALFVVIWPVQLQLKFSVVLCHTFQCSTCRPIQWLLYNY